MFRHDGAFNWYRRAGDQYSDINTYVRHDLTAWKARVTIGDANTTGDVFDTFAFRGVQLATDDRMLPDSLNGYAPVIRGIAETNARVTVRQGTSVIYDQPMPPGPFVIDDLYPTGYGGNLDVTVTEADGRTRSFQVPYASVAQLLRPGQTRYSAVVGNIRNMRLSYTPHVLQAAIQRGLTNSVTLYGGALAASHYASILGGSAVSTPIGALALDLSAAQTAAPAQTMRGVSVRVTYSKLFTATSSNLSVAAYRFSSSGYFDLNGAMAYVDAGRSGFANPAGAVNWRARNRLSIMLSQPLGDIWGNLFFSGFTQDYWTRSGTDTQFQAGYNNHYRSVGYSVSINRTRTGNGQMDMQYGHTSHAPTMSMNLMQDSSGGMSAQAVVNGQAGTDNQFGYSVEGSRNSDRTYDGSVSGQYRSPYTSISAMAGGGARYSSESLGLTGSVVVHPGGITASPYAADTIAIVAAPAAAGAAVESYPGVRLDPRGYAVVPYLTPYRINEVTLSPAGLSDDVELEVTSEQAVPRYGAIVMLRYPTVSGRPVLIRSSLPDGQPLPFGSSVFDEKGKAVGTVTQGGQIYARLNSKHERLTLKYGPADASQCTIDVTLDDPTPRTGPIRYMRLQARCVPGESPSPSHETPTAAVQSKGDAPQ
ncbi:fimbria/pilus outer membrane usher protein [Paraburkholderia xenovorans]|uniref:fimbria/pilus outer membrane usher protein n=1 Tax=Paraburkholderia xenovorans TaxID=36873 RepID=UPI0038BA0491